MGVKGATLFVRWLANSTQPPVKSIINACVILRTALFLGAETEQTDQRRSEHRQSAR